MKTGYLFLCLVFLTSGITAQNPDTLKAFRQLENGHRYYRDLRNFDSAAFYYQKAGLLFRSSGFSERYAYCLIREGLSAYRQNQLNKALNIFQNSLVIYDSLYPANHLELAAPYSRIGSVYSQLGNYHQALDYFKRSLALRLEFQGADHLQTGIAYYNVGTSFMYYGEYQNAMQAYQNALRIYLDQHGESHRRISSLYVNMGILYDKSGEPEKALEYYDKSTQIDKELYGEEYFLLAYNYYNMAIAHINLDQPQLAEELYGLTIVLSQRHNIYHLQATSHYGLGNIEKSKGRLLEAEELYHQAIALFIKHFGEDHPGINHSLRALADLWRQKGAYTRSQEYLQQTLGLLNRNYGTTHPFIALTYRQLAELYQEQGRFAEAMDQMDLAFKALSKKVGDEVPKSYEDYLDQGIFMDLLKTQSAILQDRYYQGGKHLKDLQLALQSYQEAVKIIDGVRRGYILDDSKLFLQEQAFDTYEQAIACAVDLYNISPDQKYLAMVHGFIEKSKATVLAETLQGNKLQNIQGIPDELLEQEVGLKQLISYVESSLGSAEGKVLDSLENHLFVLKRSYDTLAQHLARKYPKYYDLKYQVGVADPFVIQQQLPKGTAVLNYFLGDTQWYVFAISKEKINIHVIDSTTIPKLRLHDFRHEVINTDVDYPIILSSLLCSELVTIPLEGREDINKLIVVPHGALGHIPFDAFLTGSENTDMGSLPYLVYKYATSYTPSLTMLQLANSAGKQPKNYRGFAPSYGGSRAENLPTLKGSLEEVDFASSLFQGQVFLDNEATETVFKVHRSGAKIIHLAMHALIDDGDPMNSRLVFAPDTSGVDDGNLYAHEIYDLDLPSELAVLSACNTGYGEIARGEGIMNLSRAFQYAGSPNIVMSLWQAKDQASSAIMAYFFENIKLGLAKDEALQKAKLEYLAQADPFKSHPSQWATYVFVGNTTPLEFVDNRWKWAAFSGSFLVFIVWYLVRKRRS